MAKSKRKKTVPAAGQWSDDVLAFLALLAQSDGTDETADPLAEAQDLMWDAWDLDSRRQRVALAKKALAISPLCADAYVMLALETASSPEEAVQLYRQGVEAGAQALGDAAFREDVGDFWGILETRPYMRARQGLAEALWATGQHDEAVEHYRDMLRLNPNDNQGVRYVLLDYLLALGRDDAAADLLKRYKNDGAAAWLWSRALAAFRRDGDSAASRKALGQALKSNEHVPGYLLGVRKMPRQMPAYYTMGSEDEALCHVETAAQAWAATPGSLEWLAVAAPQPSSRRKSMAKRTN